VDEYIPPILEMAPDGTFQEVQPVRVGWGVKLFFAALGVSFVIGVVAVAVLAVYVALLAVPVVLALGVYAYLAQRWRQRQAGAPSVSRQRGRFGP
jgi:Flp pilus assembly protein TadB